YGAGRFSFNVAQGRCETCKGEGFVMVELLFLPSVYAPCPTCHGARYNAKTLEIKYRGKNIAEVLGHPEHFGDILAAVLDLQRLRVVARAMAGRARRVNAGEKEQLNHHEAFSLAGLAAALCNIEGETSGAVATRPRFLGRGEQVAYVVKQSRVGGKVRPRRTPNRLLIDNNQALDEIHARRNRA